jgi:uncharacterized membrane protein YgaE (UPF0421/DUF939 family)
LTDLHVPATVQQAAKAALAATIAWLVVLPMGGAADDYPYYAPLGAVIAVSSTVAGSVRGSVQGVVSILFGAALALVALPIVPVEVLGLAVVVAVGTWISGWHKLGQMSGWVPISAMFILIIGRTDPMSYVIGYLGLTSLGAVIGVGVNTVFPPLPLSGSGHALSRTTETLIDQLHDLADGLRQPQPPTDEEWSDRQHVVQPVSEEMRHLVAHMSEARRANWRAKRWQDRLDRQYQRALALEQLAFLVEDITTMLVDQENSARDDVALGPELRPPTADVLDAMASALDTVEGHVADVDCLREVDKLVQRLADEIRRQRHQGGDDRFTAGSVVTAVRRAIASLVPEDAADELPTYS